MKRQTEQHWNTLNPHKNCSKTREQCDLQAPYNKENKKKKKKEIVHSIYSKSFLLSSHNSSCIIKTKIARLFTKYECCCSSCWVPLEVAKEHLVNTLSDWIFQNIFNKNMVHFRSSSQSYFEHSKIAVWLHEPFMSFTLHSKIQQQTNHKHKLTATVELNHSVVRFISKIYNVRFSPLTRILWGTSFLWISVGRLLCPDLQLLL